MHHVAVALDLHEVDHLDAARLADPAEVVAAEVHQHQVLGPLLGVGEQFGGQRRVLVRGGAAVPGPGDRVQHRLAVGDLDQRLRAGADHVEAALGGAARPGEAEQVHVRAGVGGAQHAVDVQRGGRAGRLEALRGHHLEGLAGPDPLLDLLHRRPVGRPAEGRVHLAGADRGEGGQARVDGLEQAGLHRVQAAHGVRVGLVHAGVQVVVVDGVGDQQHRAVGVVEHREVGGQQHGQLGELEVVRVEVGQLLQPADDVVAEVADQAAGQRGQAVVLVARGVQRLQGGAQHLQRVAGGGDADRRGAEPAGLAVLAGGERGGAAHADEGVARPAALLGGLQQEGAGPLLGEAAVEADRGEAVREEPAGDRDDPGVDGELAEGFEIHAGRHLLEFFGLTGIRRAGARRRRSRCGRRCGRPRRSGRPSPAGCRRRSPTPPT